MSITVELLPELEAMLSTLAAEQGLSLGDYVRHLLEQMPEHRAGGLSAAERADAWQNSVRGLPRTPSLSDYAVSRESIYDERG